MPVLKSPTYNWKRFWCPRDGKLNLSDEGFLVDPEGEFGYLANSGVVSLEKISAKRCLILLGEPGIGKSNALAQDKLSTDQSLQNGDTSLWIDLRGFQSDARLYKGLFENPTFVEWAAGNRRLHLFLDSFDEGLLRIDVLSSIVGDELKKYPVERLALRIACRSADWPLSLERDLQSIWKAEQVGVFEMAPLRRSDVAEAATAEGVNANTFLQEIHRTETTALAIKPVTLRLLLSLFKRNEGLPLKKVDLYERGCRLLCDEVNEVRRERKSTGTLSVDQRMAVAARVAAATVFGNWYAVWTGIDYGDVAPEDIPVMDLVGNTETANGETFVITEGVMREVLSTGLFSLRGHHRTGWAHQTYAEFFAARYVVGNGFTDSQIMSLLVHPGDREQNIVPQLQEVSGWIASSRPSIFQQISRTDPEVLLRSDVAHADEASRANLVEALLSAADNNTLFVEIELRQDLHKLNHKNLETQLSPYISDRTRKERVREIAIEIARFSRVQGLQAPLLNIALGPTEPHVLRKQAVFSISQIGDKATRAALKPLTIGSADDVDEDLKGWALRSTWPEFLTAEELFERLTPPKRQSYIGGYRGFFQQLEESITPEILASGLNWAKQQHARNDSDIDRLVDKLLLTGLDHIHEPQIREPYIDVVIKRLSEIYSVLSDRNDRDFRDRLSRQTTTRRLLIANLVKVIAERGWPPVSMFRINRLVTDEDFSWLVERCVDELPQFISPFVQLVRFIFDARNPKHFDSIVIAARRSPALANEFTWLLKPVVLGSPEADAMKKSYLEQEQWNREEKPVLLDPSPSERVAQLLQQIESGNTAAFIQLTRDLTLKPTSTHYGDDHMSDIWAFPGWISADATTKSRIIEAARRFIQSEDPTWQWIGSDRVGYSTLAGYRALRLLLHEDIGFLEQLDSLTRKRWVPGVIGHPHPTVNGAEEDYQQILGMLAPHAEDELVRAVKLVLEKEDHEHQSVFVLRHFEKVWCTRLADMLRQKLQSATLSKRGFESVLAVLIDHASHQARAFAESLLRLPIPADGDGRDMAEIAARVLFNHAADSGWSIIWPAIQSDSVLGIAVFESTGGFGRSRPKISEDQLADLYIWLVQHYPFTEDPHFEGVHAVGSREAIARWRDDLIGYLSQQGTNAACTAIEKIIATFPDETWLNWHLSEARESMRRTTWTPPRVQDLIALARSRKLRFVQNGEQLLDVLLESLERLETKLQGETPAATFLWNKQADGKWRPKEENELSDFVKLHLEHDVRRVGIVVNREVQIRQGHHPDNPGEITDIHVDAINLDTYGNVVDILKAIIETKGCWHRELKSAMETQLRDRYLKDNQCRYGLYLIGWFNCPHWDLSDSRRRPSMTLQQARDFFNNQAVHLSRSTETIRAFVLNTALR